jgi:Rrf2 family protein
VQMNQSTDYAIQMLLYLAQATQTVPSSKLSVALGISSRYLLQIGARLRDAGLLQVSYGNFGGYVLTKSPKEITLFEVVDLMEKRTLSQKHFSTAQCEKSFSTLETAYEYISVTTEKIMKSITFESILKHQTDQWYLAEYCL